MLTLKLVKSNSKIINKFVTHSVVGNPWSNKLQNERNYIFLALVVQTALKPKIMGRAARLDRHVDLQTFGGGEGIIQ